MKILIITNEFLLPINSSRKQKLWDRINYLIKNNWEPIILIPNENNDTLFYKINNKIIKIYTCRDPLKYFTNGNKNNLSRNKMDNSKLKENLLHLIDFPDYLIRWVLPMIIIANSIIKKENIQVICTINFPFSFHLIGLFIKTINPSILWIAEFRDPWIKNFLIHKENKIKLILHKIMEKYVIQKSDKIIFYKGNPLPPDYFFKTYHYIDNTKFDYMPFMGFNIKDFETISKLDYNYFVISYSGSFYKNKIEPISFLLGLNIFLQKYNISENKLKVNFLGDWNQDYDSILDNYKLTRFIQKYGWIERSRCIKILKGSNLLLLIIPEMEEWKYGTTAKFWEYIGCKKPILALVNNNYLVANIINNEKLGLIAKPSDPQDIAHQIEKAYFETEFFYNPSESFFQYVNSENVEKKFLVIINNLNKVSA